MNEESKEFRVIKKPRIKKLNPRIDLSSMVSISFLLIVFFMVTVELSRPQMMNIGRPDTSCGPDYYGCQLLDKRRVITLLLDDNNKIISYKGILEVPDEKPTVLKYGREGIRKELMCSNRQIMKLTGRNDATIVIIKPSIKSNYGNLVDILDEMAINKISNYSIMNDFTPEESKLLALK